MTRRAMSRSISTQKNMDTEVLNNPNNGCEGGLYGDHRHNQSITVGLGQTVTVGKKTHPDTTGQPRSRMTSATTTGK